MTDSHISQETKLAVFENKSEKPHKGDYVVVCTGEVRIIAEDKHTELPFRVGLVKREIVGELYVIHWLGNEHCSLDGPWLPGHISKTTRTPHYTESEIPAPQNTRHLTSSSDEHNPHIHTSQIVLWGFKCLQNGHLPVRVIRAIAKCTTLKIS